MTTTYEKIDKDTYKEIRKAEKIISMKALEKEISDLEKGIAGLPQPKTKPDQETLDFWNEQVGSLFDSGEYERTLAEKKELKEKLEEIEGLK